MNISRTFLIGVGLSSMLLGGCASQVTEEEQYSGFLPSYEGLRETTSANGQPVMRWVADGFSPNDYDTVVFNQLELYPAPRPDDRVNLQTLQELQALTSSSVKGVLAQKYNVVPSANTAPAASRTLVLNAAITGVSATNEGMQWYEALPVTAVAGAVSRAAGYRDQNTELFLEANLVDASTGQAVVKTVRKVRGENLEDSTQAIATNDFKLAIRGLAADLNAFINN
ncbi:DUF3313 domain-containing protein [Halopseudomonas pelagia]|uniref:DUF3313 domain-containing protein n=1 Tax=Halopseudomonas pelagia TaxID=553151 RepID=A0AA91U0C2_9GAMM|nr:DUF3313 domain-containing protein [Halopseudomonas pelagia]PCC98137.1 DUF3313 domain-containing protein [Halopseudomonas pelagia]QFY55049.1 DUF3313 domain-containing protein [Halopseudomonas pelagia]